MAKSKKERRSSIRHMQAEGDVLAIFEALDRAEKEDPAARPAAIADEDGDDDPDGPPHT